MFGTLHPAIVHIPIGLLFVYSALEVVFAFFPKKRDAFFLTRYVMLIIGVLGSFVALSSGEALEHSVRGSHDLIHTHSFFASATVWVYAVLAVAYSVLLLAKYESIMKSFANSSVLASVWTWLQKISQWVTRPAIAALLAVMAGVLLLITGALGAAIAHGPDADPVVAAVYGLFF